MRTSSVSVERSRLHAGGALAHVVRTFRERLLSGFSWNLLAALTLQGSVLISSVIVARLLGLESFGAYAILVSTAMTIASIAQGSSGLVASKFVGENLVADPQRVANMLRMCRAFAWATGAVASGLTLLGARVLSEQLLGRAELEPMVRLLAIAVLFQTSVAYQFGALQGFGAFKELSRASMLAGLGQVAFTVAGAWLGQVGGALAGFIAASAFRTLVLGRMLARVRRARGVPDEVVAHMRGAFGPIWRFALPSGLAGFVTMPCLWLVVVLVARLPDGLALAAILSVAHQVRLSVLQLPSLLNAVSFSVLSRLKGQHEHSGFRSVFWSNLWMNLLLATIVVAALVTVAEPVLRLYGPDFASGRWTLVLLLISVLPELLAMSLYQLIQSAGRMWHSLFLIAMPRDLLYLALAAVLVPAHGVFAAAAAYLGAQVVGLLATLLTARRHAPGPVWSNGR